MTLRELQEIAVNNLKDIVPLKDPDFRLEQAEFMEDDKTWEVVVSYLVENTNKRQGISTLAVGDFEFDRLYKMLVIDQKKNVIKMLIHSNRQ